MDPHSFLETLDAISIAAQEGHKVNRISITRSCYRGEANSECRELSGMKQGCTDEGGMPLFLLYPIAKLSA